MVWMKKEFSESFTNGNAEQTTLRRICGKTK
jgi:hypothetical protein